MRHDDVPSSRSRGGGAPPGPERPGPRTSTLAMETIALLATVWHGLLHHQVVACPLEAQLVEPEMGDGMFVAGLSGGVGVLAAATPGTTSTRPRAATATAAARPTCRFCRLWSRIVLRSVVLRRWASGGSQRDASWIIEFPLPDMGNNQLPSWLGIVSNRRLVAPPFRRGLALSLLDLGINPDDGANGRDPGG